jgi:nucleoside 2-deoxyribosyltransferase
MPPEDAPRVYLAGPDVFFPDAPARGAMLKAICAQHGLHGVFPLDAPADIPSAWKALPEAHRIARCNEAHIRASAALIANLTPFRGPSADVGTVFELGFMRALGRPVFGWSNAATPFTERTVAHFGATALRGADGAWRDPDCMLIEAFGLADNLMIDAAIAASGGAYFMAEAADRWADLAMFERCVAAAASVLRGV